MFKACLLSIAIMLTVASACLQRAEATPLAPSGLTAVAPVSDVQPIYYRGRYYRGGGWRVGGRYYGGVWYGTGRRWYGGRWWAYGVGSCWRPSPMGYVWVCG
jgi:hypothetical protein